MADKYVEKSFLYLLAFSVLLHFAVYQLIIRLPYGSLPKKGEQTTMVDLTDIPLPPEPVKPRKTAPQPPVAMPRPSLRPEQPSTVDRFAETRQRVPREMAPRQPLIPSPLPLLPPAGHPQARPHPAAPAPAPKAEPLPSEKGGQPVARGEGIFKSKGHEPAARPALFPSAGTLARLEERYRSKYSPEVEEGDTGFLNTDDIRFGSFYRRLETAVYGVWQYPREAAERGIEGTTPVRITFNRKGEVVQVDILETSGSRILDNEVLRTLHEIGPIGSLPRGYSGDTFKVIAFFHYINGSGRLR